MVSGGGPNPGLPMLSAVRCLAFRGSQPERLADKNDLTLCPDDRQEQPLIGFETKKSGEIVRPRQSVNVLRL